MVQEQGNRNVTLSQNQAKMMMNWDMVQESGDSGNDWDGEVPETSQWDKLSKDVTNRIKV